MVDWSQLLLSVPVAVLVDFDHQGRICKHVQLFWIVKLLALHLQFAHIILSCSKDMDICFALTVGGQVVLLLLSL